MKNSHRIIFFLFFVLSLATTSCASKKTINPPSSIPTTNLQGFNEYPKDVQNLITRALNLTKQNLDYKFGSADPKNGGMDCSGTIYYLLQSLDQKDVPRQSDQIYFWVKKRGKFHPVKSRTFSSKEFQQLKPGDLLFWTGTYPVKRKSPISHVMLYLGKNKQGKHLMFGASNGRTYKNKQIWGVSVFDFNLPSAKSKSRFIGYSCIPGVTCK